MPTLKVNELESLLGKVIQFSEKGPFFDEENLYIPSDVDQKYEYMNLYCIFDHCLYKQYEYKYYINIDESIQNFYKL